MTTQDRSPTVWGRFITARAAASDSTAAATQVSSTANARQPKSQIEAMPPAAVQ